MCRARLAWRSPPGFQAVAAALAGGDRDRACAAERCKRAFAVQAIDVLSGGDEQLAGVAGRDAKQRNGPRSSSCDERSELRVEVCEFIVQECDTACETAQRELGGVGRVGEVRGVRPQAATEGGPADQRLAFAELFAQVAGRGDQQISELHDGDRAGLHRAVSCDPQLPDRFDDPVRLLRRDGGGAAECVTGGHLGVDRVGFAASSTGVRMGLVDLDDHHALRDQIAVSAAA